MDLQEICRNTGTDLMWRR